MIELIENDDRNAAQWRLDRFVRQFGPEYRSLVLVVAVPIVLTPELVGYLRGQFLPGVSWVAEADLLLSELCRSVGYERYVMDSGVQSIALQELDIQKPGQVEEIAQVLVGYVQHLARVNPYLSDRQRKHQQWAAMLCVVKLRAAAIEQIAVEVAHWEGAISEPGSFGAGRSEMAFLDQVLKEQRSRLLENAEYLKLATRVSQAMGRMNAPIEIIEIVSEVGTEDSFEIIEPTIVPGFPPLQMFEFETVTIEEEGAIEEEKRIGSGKNWAVVVGVNDYQYITSLKYANRDAEAMRDFFNEAKFDRVFCFADGVDGAKLPRFSELEDFLNDCFTTKVKPLTAGDNIWFFFAGQGKRINNGDYLLPSDYNPRLPNPEQRAIAINFVRESLLKSGADNVILLLDAGRKEGDRSSSVGIGDKQPGAITVFSCQRNKSAYEIDALQQGAFTVALLEALRMPGERNCATVERLDLYLRDRVPQICWQHDKPEQMPMTLVEPQQKSYLILLPQFATDRDIAMLRLVAQGAELEEDLEVAEQLFIRVIAATQGRDLSALNGFSRIQRKRLHVKQLDEMNQIEPTRVEVDRQQSDESIYEEEDIDYDSENWENSSDEERYPLVYQALNNCYESVIVDAFIDAEYQFQSSSHPREGLNIDEINLLEDGVSVEIIDVNMSESPEEEYDEKCFPVSTTYSFELSVRINFFVEIRYFDNEAYNPSLDENVPTFGEIIPHQMVEATAMINLQFEGNEEPDTGLVELIIEEPILIDLT